MKPRLIVQQKITSFVNKYNVYAADEHKEIAGYVAFCQQKRFAFKEKLPFYTSQDKKELSFTLTAEKVFDIHGKYSITDANGQKVGVFSKDFKKSFAASTWHILSPSGEPMFTLRENNPTVALLRRYASLIPFIGPVIDFLMMFFKYHFEIITPAGEVVGLYEKTTLFRDHYCLSVTDEAWQAVDWRTYTAVAVALDALQSR